MTEDDVVRTHTLAFNGALKAKDWSALSEIYYDDYMLVRPDVRVRIQGDMALLTGESRTVTSRGADEAKAHVRLIAVYVAHGDALQLTHFQSVLLPE